MLMVQCFLLIYRVEDGCDGEGRVVIVEVNTGEDWMYALRCYMESRYSTLKALFGHFLSKMC